MRSLPRIMVMVAALSLMSLAATACSDDVPTSRSERSDDPPTTRSEGSDDPPTTRSEGSDDPPTRRSEGFPSPAAAPTPAGEVVELAAPEVRAEAVLVGLESSDTAVVRALPGVDQPPAGEISPGEGIVVLGQAFRTADGLVWWQIDGGGVQGWLSPENIAFRGTPRVVTDEALAAFDSDGAFAGPEAAARAVAESLAIDRDATDVVIVSTTRLENPVSATVTVDVLGIDDGTTRGLRLLIASAEARGWIPVSVIEAPLCSSGVTPSGRCR